MTEQTAVQKATDALTRGAEFGAARDEEAALPHYREAVRLLLSAFQEAQAGETLHLLLVAFRGLAVAALITNRIDEGRAALGTGLTHVGVGLQHWADAPPLLEEQARLKQLADRVGGEAACSVVLPGTDGEPWTWPFDD